MRNYATYKLVWNRKKEEREEAPVQIEILLPSGRQKWVGTGLKVRKDQWDETNRQVKNDPFAGHLNKQLSGKIDRIRAHELSLIDAGRVLTAIEVDRALEKKAAGSFLAFMRAQIDARSKKVSKNTQYLHERVANNLESCGIVRYDDLTYLKIVNLDNFLNGFLVRVSVAKQHQVVRQYIDMATDAGLIPYGHNPYIKFKYPRGKSKIRTRLDDQDIKNLIAAPVGETRDLAVFQLHTGIAHRDVEKLTWNDNIRFDGEEVWIEGLRNKSGELYSIFLPPEAVSIIRRYKGGSQLVPCPELWKYNRDLKVLAAGCGIKRNLTSYVLRHSYATWMLRKGVSITTIRDTMGHAGIDTTLIYARLEKQTIKSEMKKAFGD